MARAGSASRKQKQEQVPTPPRPPAKGTAARGRIEPPKPDEGREGRQGLRRRMGQRVMKIGFLRRRYVKRVIRYIDKSKKKGRRMPPEMMELQRFLSQIPKEERAKRLEEAILAQQSGDEAFNRDLRRAAANQQRRSGKGAGGYRPGAPPRSMAIGPRPSKKPR
ncbi:MAG: hypothetical protein ACYDEN_07135 [Acidimicrobiales bacterium]